MSENMQITASREIPVAASVVFDLLSNPARHNETDASGMVQSTDKGERLQKVGDTFRMNMRKGDGSEYQTDNEVFALQPDRVIGWKNTRNVTSDVEVGSKWLYELEPIDAERTKVSLTYDYSEIADAQIVAMAKQNFADTAVLDKSLATLAEALA